MKTTVLFPLSLCLFMAGCQQANTRTVSDPEDHDADPAEAVPAIEEIASPIEEPVPMPEEAFVQAQAQDPLLPRDDGSVPVMRYLAAEGYLATGKVTVVDGPHRVTSPCWDSLSVEERKIRGFDTNRRPEYVFRSGGTCDLGTLPDSATLVPVDLGEGGVHSAIVRLHDPDYPWSAAATCEEGSPARDVVKESELDQRCPDGALLLVDKQHLLATSVNPLYLSWRTADRTARVNTARDALIRRQLMRKYGNTR